jgi:hypothetical protein
MYLRAEYEHWIAARREATDAIRISRAVSRWRNPSLETSTTTPMSVIVKPASSGAAIVPDDWTLSGAP